MKLSRAWLEELLGRSLQDIDLPALFVRAGLEVESVAQVGDFSGVLVAEVRAVRPHPNAKKLNLVDVVAGGAVTQVVCGAANVPAPGGRVLWAPPGARLPGNIVLGEKDIRGVVSPGMLCAEDELGLGEGHDGIIVLGANDPLPVGAEVAPLLGLPDLIIDIKVTPNRADCLGHLGAAREIAAQNRWPLPAVLAKLPVELLATPALVIDANTGCREYVAVTIDRVHVQPSPLKIRLRLALLDTRSISNVVDATNLALLETGQPLHAFDRQKLSGEKIQVRFAAAETLAALDKKGYQLAPQDVVIADADKAVAIAGVIGGANSEVTDATTQVLLECAHFAPDRVRHTSRRLGLQTEASYRFERGIDRAALTQIAVRAAEITAELSGGTIRGMARWQAPVEDTPSIIYRPDRTNRLLGADIAHAEQLQSLRAIGCTVMESPAGEIAVTAPSWRHDLTREADLVEEVGRLRGYDTIAPLFPPMRFSGQAAAEVEDGEDELRRRMCNLGFDEIITYGFVSPDTLESFPLTGAVQPVRLTNPLRHEQSQMRTTLLPGLLSAVKHNMTHGETDFALFEVGSVFVREASGNILETRKVAGALVGRRAGSARTTHEHWTRADDAVDFYDLKGVVDKLAVVWGEQFAWTPAATAWLHPGKQAKLAEQGGRTGYLGELHPQQKKHWDVSGTVFLFEIDAMRRNAKLGVREFQEIARFPAVQRDLSFFVAESVPAGDLQKMMLGAKSPLCVHVEVLEDYRASAHVPVGKKAMLFGFTYRSAERTLKDEEVDEAHRVMVAKLVEVAAIELR